MSGRPPSVPVDESDLATRLALGDSLNECARTLDINVPVLHRRVRKWRRGLADDAKSDAEKLYWLEHASIARIARRWLWIQTSDERWRPVDGLETY